MRKLVARINHSSNLILKYTFHFKVMFHPVKGRWSFTGCGEDQRNLMIPSASQAIIRWPLTMEVHVPSHENSLHVGFVVYE